jgi:DNA mismatch repair ATPase MutL
MHFILLCTIAGPRKVKLSSALRQTQHVLPCDCCQQLYLHQLLETGGSSRQPPPGVVRVLKSKACRSAIMFGTQLSREQCVELVQQLGQTELCFCCAHGR